MPPATSGVDWFTPDGLSGWGDGRTFILGTLGYMELRKYLNVATEDGGNHIYLVDGAGEHHLAVTGQVGYPYFGELVLDCLERTERAMPQAHAVQGGRTVRGSRAAGPVPSTGLRAAPFQAADQAAPPTTVVLAEVGEPWAPALPKPAAVPLALTIQ